VGKRSRKRRDPAAPERRAGSAPRDAPPAKKKRRGPEPRPWPERPSVTRAKNEAARDALREAESRGGGIDAGAEAKARNGARAAATNGEPSDRADRASRTERKNAEARAALEPLAPGERPRAVTVGAIVTTVAATGNLIAYLAGGEIQGQRPAAVGVLAFTALMYVMAGGLWRARYWAVLGLEAILGMILVFFSLFALRIETAIDALVSAAVLIPAGALFWFLIRAMARIQMPQRPGSEP
jgi:hypothetical protein